MTMRPLILLVALLCGSAQAAPLCKPAQLGGAGSTFEQSFNPRGAWVGYWCPDGAGGWFPYVSVITPQYLKNIAVEKLVMSWVQYGDVSDLVFGSDPFTDPTLLAVWQPERAKLDAVKPK